MITWSSRVRLAPAAERLVEHTEAILERLEQAWPRRPGRPWRHRVGAAGLSQNVMVVTTCTKERAGCNNHA